MKKSILALLFIALSVLIVVSFLAIGKATSAAGLQRQQAGPGLDAVKADPKHYKVEYENDSIRVLRATYGPHEKSPMHSHPANLTIGITAGQTKFVLSDGKSEISPANPGGFSANPAVTHSSENIGDQKFETFVVELKGKDKP